MRVELLATDSRVFGGNVLAIQQFDPNVNFAEFEADYVCRLRPVYVSCKIALQDISSVHILENHGFRLVECQIRSSIRLNKSRDVSRFPFIFERITREEDLKPVLEIAGTTITHDRFSIDGFVGHAISGARYREYVRNSFVSSDEAVFRLVDKSEGKTVAFKTHRYVSSTEVLFLLGGVHPDYKNLGVGIINEYCEFNWLMSKGIKRGITHISACNYPVFNLEIGNLGFRVMATFAVMRKIYSPESL